MGITDRLKHAWNAFNSKETSQSSYSNGYYYRPDRVRFSRHNERSIISSVYNRIAIDVASKKVRHVRLDLNGRFMEEIDSKLNNCLSLEANIDQTGRAFIQDAVMSMLDEGVVALVPVDTEDDIHGTETLKIKTVRAGKIVQWYPQHVKVNLYNEKTGKKQDVIVPKRIVAIVENPFYSVMNEPNSTAKRLSRKLSLLDSIDEQSGSGKLDMIIQLPYTIKSDARQKQAEDRRAKIEEQLANSKYGIAYADATEKITQLNRPLENNLLKQIEYLTDQLFAQLGMDKTILNGTADEKTMLNYTNNILEVILSAFSNEMKRKWLTKTARSQGHSIEFFSDPFKLVPVNNLADIADKFTRNEIMTSNEIRQIIGMPPSDDPNADELRNKNLNQSPEQMMEEPQEGYEEGYEEEPAPEEEYYEEEM